MTGLLPMRGPTAPSALDDAGVELATVARRFLAERSPSSVVREQLEADEERLPPFWDALAELGWIGLAVPEAAGGEGGSVADLCTFVEEWGRAVAAGPYPGTAVVATVLGRHLPDAVTPLLGGEPAAVVPDHTMPVDGGASAVWFLVRGDRGWRLAHRSQVEVRAHRSADGARRVATVELRADADPARLVKVPVEDGEVLDLVALVRSAEAVGVASWCVHTAADHARERHQFDRPIGQFQAVKHRCADALCRLEAARAATWDAARLAEGDPERALAVAVAASLAPAAAFACAKDAIQVLGGIGYTWEHDAHLYLRRAATLHHLDPGPALGAAGGRAGWRDAVVVRVARGERRTLGLELGAEADAHREEVRRFVDELKATDNAKWNVRLADGGWISPHWPRPWGRSAGPLEQLVIDEELRAAGVRRPHLQVAGWVLPTLIAHGTPEQQERFIGPSLRLELRWCQLFSEPGAGSDLASLTTRADRVAGGWAITGQKVWTTLAREADWGICLARTDQDAPKHDGIGCFLVDMSTPGIEVRPLRELTGFAMFNEVFLDGVFVPDECVVGGATDGWRCARTTLENERVSMGSGSSFGPGALALLDLAHRSGSLDDPCVRDELGSILALSEALAVLGLRTTLRALHAGGRVGEPGPEASVRKLMGVELEQRIQEVGLELLGPSAVVDEGEGATWFGGFLGNRALSIAGGTSEIQRNVIGERLLGLPRD